MGFLLAILGGFDFDFAKFIFGYLILGTAHLSVSFSNDYFDRYSDRKTIKTAFSGGSKILIEHPEFESLALKLAVLLLFSSIVVNVFFTLFYSYPFWFFIFALIGALIGWFYSAPPMRLAYRGLGELCTILVVGFMMPGIGYIVASGNLGQIFLAFTLSLSCYSLFFIITVELPDVQSDTIGWKKNILVNWGIENGKRISVVAALIGTVSLIVLPIFGITKEIIDVNSFIIFSFIPLMASTTTLLANTKNRTILVRQVMINITSTILFLVLIDVSLFFQLIS
jgi:1,4-dihydroxy-2-naphthoate octaprenyltransferase